VAKKNGKVEAAFSEVHKNTPKAVKKTTAKKGKAAGEKQRVAIALSKARAAGAKIPEAPHNSPPTMGIPSAAKDYPNSNKRRGLGKTTGPHNPY
jgi:hypothetical protein